LVAENCLGCFDPTFETVVRIEEDFAESREGGLNGHVLGLLLRALVQSEPEVLTIAEDLLIIVFGIASAK